MQQRIGALLVRSDVLFNGRPEQLAALCQLRTPYLSLPFTRA
jgi:hypothetical protein